MIVLKRRPIELNSAHWLIVTFGKMKCASHETHPWRAVKVRSICYGLTKQTRAHVPCTIASNASSIPVNMMKTGRWSKIEYLKQRKMRMAKEQTLISSWFSILDMINCLVRVCPLFDIMHSCTKDVDMALCRHLSIYIHGLRQSIKGQKITIWAAAMFCGTGVFTKQCCF